MFVSAGNIMSMVRRGTAIIRGTQESGHSYVCKYILKYQVACILKLTGHKLTTLNVLRCQLATGVRVINGRAEACDGSRTAGSIVTR